MNANNDRNNGAGASVEVLDLIDALFDGAPDRERITAEQFARLQTLIVSDAVARRYYVDALHLQAGLQWDHSTENPTVETLNGGSLRSELADLPTAAAARREADMDQAGGAETELSLRRAQPRQPFYRHFSWSAVQAHPIASSFLLAAAVVLVGLTLMAIWRIPNLGRPQMAGGLEEINPQRGDASPPARIAGATEAKNAEGEPYAADTLIPYGKWHHLATGWLELETVLGARMTLEAPASFVMVDSNSVRLALGQLSAAVPARAKGLTVLTPTARVVDRGTEFGVRVAGQGTTEVHVFQGRVDVTSTRALRQGAGDAALNVNTVKLSADMAVRVLATRQDEETFETIPSDRSAFLRLSPSGAGDDAFEAVPVVRYWYSAGKLTDDHGEEYSPYRDDDHGKLTGDRPLTPIYFSGRWAGFPDARGVEGDSETPQPQIDFELPELPAGRELAHLELVYFVYHKSAIHAPSEMRVFAADNETFENPREVAAARHFNDDDRVGTNPSNWQCIRRIRVPLEGVHERFIRLDFRNGNEWTFIGEVRFFGPLQKTTTDKENAGQE